MRMMVSASEIATTNGSDSAPDYVYPAKPAFDSTMQIRICVGMLEQMKSSATARRRRCAGVPASSGVVSGGGSGNGGGACAGGPGGAGESPGNELVTRIQPTAEMASDPNGSGNAELDHVKIAR